MPWASVHHRFYLKLRSRKHALEGTVWIRCCFDWLKTSFTVHLMDIESCPEVRRGRIYDCWYLQICDSRLSFLIDIESMLFFYSDVLDSLVIIIEKIYFWFLPFIERFESIMWRTVPTCSLVGRLRSSYQRHGRLYIRALLQRHGWSKTNYHDILFASVLYSFANTSFW